jgi:hypothetical protein
MQPQPRVVRIFLTFVVAAAAVFGGAVSGQTLLRWKFKPGEVLDYEIWQEMKSKGSATADATGMNMKLTMNMTWKIQDVDSDGNASMTISVRRIRMKVDSAPGMNTDFDSDSDKEPEGMSADVATAFKAWLKKPFSLKISARGKVSDMKLPETLPKLTKRETDLAHNIFSKMGFELAEMPELPEEAITPEKTWFEKSTTKFTGANVEMESAYRYIGKTRKNGQSLDQINAVQTLTKSAKEKTTHHIEVKKLDGEGTILFDNAAGHAISSAMKSKISLSAEVLGTKVEETSEIETRIRFVPHGDK